MSDDNNTKRSGKLMKKTEKTIRKDLIVIGALLLSGLLLMVGVLLFSRDGRTVEVRVDGAVKYRYSLSENRRVTLKGANNGSNVLVIQSGEAWIEEADCPDGLCIKTGRISKEGQSIICLPHKLVAEITSKNAESSGSDIDAYVK